MKDDIQVAHVTNRQASVVGTGVAVDSSRIIYIGLAGHKTALKSVWATLNKREDRRNGRELHTEWSGCRYIQPLGESGGGYVQLWTPIPQTNLHHLAILHRLAQGEADDDRRTYLLAWECEGAVLHRRRAYYDYYDPEGPVNARRKEPADRFLPDLQARLVHRLNRHLATPVLPEWGAYLWDVALTGIGESRYNRRCGLIELTARGDCIAACRADLTWPWAEVIGQGLKEGHIAF